MAAASLPLEEFDEKFLTCPVCEEIYTDPRVLPCLHTFCARCLDKWRNGESQFTCPTCRNQVRLQGTDISSLPPNFFMNSLLDFRALHRSEEDHTQCQMCKSDTKVDGRCADCSFLMCQHCIAIHSNIPALKDHYIITVHDLENPSSRPKYTRARYCPRHTDQRMTFYCQPCAKLVCRDCTITEHRPGPNHDPQEVREVARKYKAELQTLVEKTKDKDFALKKAKETVGQELRSIETNCQRVRQEIKQHFAHIRAKLDEEETKITVKLDKMEKTQAKPLVNEEKKLEDNIKSTEDGLKFSTDILARGNDVEILTLRQQLEDRLNVLSSVQIHHEAVKNKISFQQDNKCSNLVECYLFLSDESLFITESPVESLPTTVIFRPQAGRGLRTHSQVTVTSPGGKCDKLDTARSNEGTFKATWRPQTSGKHVVGVTTGGGGGVTGGRSLCSPITVDVSSNNPVLRFGQEGRQQGQFDRPIDVAVMGDRVYVADTFNQRVQVFDLKGNFCYSFSTASNPASLAVHTDGTIVVKSEEEVKTFTPSGKLVHKFSLSKYCTNSYGLAVQRGGRIVVADPDKNIIFLFDADGALVKHSEGQEGGQFKRPTFVCVDEEDKIIASDKGGDCVQVFDRNLNFLYKFGQFGKQPQDMVGPIGVSADSRRNIVLSNMGFLNDEIEHSKKLQVFCLDGTWVSTINSHGDKLNKPHGVAVTHDGHVFVTDTGDHCIRKYRYM